jgi:hypothetical protein
MPELVRAVQAGLSATFGRGVVVMKTLIAIAALALPMLLGTGAQAATPNKVYKRILQNASGTPLKASKAHNSQYYKITNGIGSFRKIKLGNKMFATTAYIPAPGQKGFKPFSAYIVRRTKVTGLVVSVERTSVPDIEFRPGIR